MEIALSISFKRAFRKKVRGRPEIEDLFWNKAAVFIEDPFDSSLKTHKLSGQLKDLWSFVVFYFEDNNTKAIFVNIGSHDEVY